MTAACVRPGICVPTQMSQPSLVTCTVQFIGSIVACARNGCWYTASIFCAARAMAAPASPSWRATAPGFSDAAASWATMSAVESFAFGPASHCGAAAASPCFAAQV